MFVFNRCRCQAFGRRTSRQNVQLTPQFPCVTTQISGAQACAGTKTVEIPRSGCRDHGHRCQRPCPGFLLFLNFRLLRRRLVSLTSVLKDSESASDISSPHSPIFMCPAPVSSLPELDELHDSVPRGAASPDASPISSSLSMGTKPKDGQSALLSSDSDPDPPLNTTVDSDPDDSCCVTYRDHSRLEHMPSIANPFATSLPYTLTCVGTSSHLTSLPGFAASRSSISQTGTWTCCLPDVVVHPFDFKRYALPVAPSCRYCESVRIASFGTQNPCRASSVAKSSALLFVGL